MANNPFEESDILEGFICPICREDLKSVDALMCHFDRTHAEEEDAVKSILRDIFTKAKKKIRINFEEASSDLSQTLENSARIVDSSTNCFKVAVKQEVGVERCHNKEFQSVRNPRIERYASETNKLIIRLHRLLKDMPTDPGMRKKHEQETVVWLDGSSVKLCPNCAKNFHLARRQHHCRLCGSIMCNDCSNFLSLDTALDLASLTMTQTDSLKQMQSLNSSKLPGGNNQQQTGIRTCGHCLWLLETRQQMHESRTCHPLITEIYSEIQQLRKDVTPHIDMYLKIINSLYEGESIFTIADASSLRGKIGQCAESIDLRSKRIIALTAVQGSREAVLHKVIRLYCIQLIKEKILSIPPLPTEEEIRKVQDRKRMETEQRIQTERRKALEAHERYGLATSNEFSQAFQYESSKYVQGSDLNSFDNWMAHQVHSVGAVANDDPLVEQINIIKGYIKQARQDMHFDVVETLELNLRELQREFYNRHKKKSTPETKGTDDFDSIH